MSSDPKVSAGAFARLEARLAARRLAAVDVRMRVTLAAIVLLLTGFVFWKIRIPLQGVRHFHGEAAVAQSVALWLAAWLFAAGAIAASRMAAMAPRVPGPEWLALPLPPGAVARHLRHEARQPALLAFAGAVAVLVASIEYMPPLWIALGLVLFTAAWFAVTHASVWAAREWAARSARTRRPLPAMTRLLATGGRRRAARALPRPAWRARSATQAVAQLDRWLSLRATAARTRIVLAGLFALVSIVPWLSRWSGAEQRAWSFAAFTLGCTALGAWAIARVGGDPPETLRPLPLPLGAVWRARFFPMVGALVALAVLDALLATHMPAVGRVGMIVTWLIPGLAIAVLGLHYGITLAPQARAAENLYFSWLGVAVAGSLMVPLMGWAVLIAGLIHSTRRLRVWWRPEAA